MAGAQVGFRQKGEDNCIHHPGQKLTFQCDDCSGNLVCNTCASSFHRGHYLSEIKLVVKGKVKKINSFIRKTSKESVPKITHEIKLTTERLKENEQKYSNAIKEIESQRDILYSGIELRTSLLISLFESKLKEHKEILEKHIDVLEKLQKDLEKKIGECEKVAQSGTDILVCDTEAYLALIPEVIIPKTPSLISSTVFCPCKIPTPHIEKAFGETIEVKPIPSDNVKHQNYKQKKRVVADKHETKPNYKFTDPTTVCKHDLSCDIQPNGICPTSDNMVWIHDKDEQLHLIDDTGTEQQTLTLDVDAQSITTHPITGDLYCGIIKDKSVRRVNTRTGETTVMFTTNVSPISIACTKDDHMVVGKTNTVRTYTFTGQVLHEYNSTSIWSPCISVCNTTNHVAVALRKDGVLVLNASLQELYTYTRQPGGQGGNMDRKELLCFTSVFVDKYLLIGDSDNNDISVISASDGSYVRTIHTKKMSGVKSLGVQQNGCLWVGCNNKSMLCVKCWEQHSARK